VIIDSGMPLVWREDQNVTIDDYTEFCLQNLQSAELVYSLSRRPGRPGQTNITSKEVEESASRNSENYEYMVKKGIPAARLIYAFHQGEPFNWLKQAVNNTKHIALFPYFADEREKRGAIEWLHECMSCVLDKHGRPIIDLHSLANSFKIMKLFPWSTVYLTNWEFPGGASGKIYIPLEKQGVYDYSSTRPNLIHVSEFDSLSPHIKRVVINYLESLSIPLGLSESEKGACNSRGVRQFLNTRYINMFAKTIGDVAYRDDRTKGLF